MKRVIFVGIHNKPGLSPLDSSTKTGKMIDRIIANLPDGFECEKTNLFKDDIPSKVLHGQFVESWIRRVQFKEDTAEHQTMVVFLGTIVWEAFLWNTDPLLIKRQLALRHPSRADRNYFEDAVGKIICGGWAP